MKQKEKILVVDDEEVIRSLLMQILTKEGYLAISAGNGFEALEELDKGTFDLVITDIKMPGMTGIELMDRIREKDPEVVILVMTGFGSLETAMSAIKHGAFDYIMKPFKVDNIKTAIDKAIQRNRLARENTKLKETLSLFEASKALSQTMQMDDLLNLILTSALRQTGGTRGSLMILDDKSGNLTIRASIGVSDDIVKNSHVKIGEGISGQVAESGKPVFIDDVSEHPKLGKLSHHFPDKSFISIPLIGSKGDGFLHASLKLEKKLIGVLNLNRPETGRVFSRGDINLLSILANQAAISIENAQLFQNLEEAYLNTMKSLTLILEGKSPYTQGHSERVTEYSIDIAREMSLTSKEMYTLKYAASLHDIGKIGINDSILNKPGKLSDDEFDIIKQHPRLGYEMIKPIKFLESVLSTIRHHHERVDGKGYPDGISGEDLTIMDRICMVADAYDAMNSDRPYRKALSKEIIFAEFDRQTGTQFDKDVVSALIKTKESRPSDE